MSACCALARRRSQCSTVSELSLRLSQQRVKRVIKVRFALASCVVPWDRGDRRIRRRLLGVAPPLGSGLHSPIGYDSHSSFSYIVFSSSPGSALKAARARCRARPRRHVVRVVLCGPTGAVILRGSPQMGCTAEAACSAPCAPGSRTRAGRRCVPPVLSSPRMTGCHSQ